MRTAQSIPGTLAEAAPHECQLVSHSCSLAHTEVGDQFIDKIRALKSLQDLNMDDTQVSSASESVIASFTKLEEFYAWDTRIDTETLNRLEAGAEEHRKECNRNLP